MAANDLTTLVAVKLWLGRTDANSDGMLTALITSTSRQILSYLQRSIILPRTVTETRDGTGGATLVLRQWPVISVASLSVCGQAVSPATTPTGCGWSLDAWDGAPPGQQQRLSVSGSSFGIRMPGLRPQNNVVVTYQAGYQVSAEPQTIDGGAASVIAPYGAWASDAGVTYANGTALTKVASSPAIGQYALDASAGTYDFNVGDNGQAVLISYGFVPSDLADACMELVSERFKYSERIAETSHSLGGNETVSFNTSRFTPLIAAMLQPYRNVLPI